MASPSTGCGGLSASIRTRMHSSRVSLTAWIGYRRYCLCHHHSRYPLSSGCVISCDCVYVSVSTSFLSASIPFWTAIRRDAAAQCKPTIFFTERETSIWRDTNAMGARTYSNRSDECAHAHSNNWTCTRSGITQSEHETGGRGAIHSGQRDISWRNQSMLWARKH